MVHIFPDLMKKLPQADAHVPGRTGYTAMVFFNEPNRCRQKNEMR
jgi:hypothetical protein